MSKQQTGFFKNVYLCWAVAFIVFYSSLFILYSASSSVAQIYLRREDNRNMELVSSVNISIPQINDSIDSFWNHTDLIQRYVQLSHGNINQAMDSSILYSYSYQELMKIYGLFGCDKQKQINCANGVSSTCKLRELNECDLPKLVNKGANCNLNDLKDIIIDSYKQKHIPRIYHITLRFDGKDKKLTFFQLMYYLSIKSYYKFGKPDAIILHYVVLNKNNGAIIEFNSYKNKYFQDSLKFITHFCEWDYIPTIFGNKYSSSDLPARSTDIIRIFATTLFGGIYYDLDVFMFNQTESRFNELLNMINPSHTMIPREKTKWKKYMLCSCILIAQKWSIFNIEWIYQLKNKINQLRWPVKWGEIAVKLPKRISDKIFIGNDSYKYINELDTKTYFYTTWWDKSPWKKVHSDSNKSIGSKTLWCHQHVNVYGWHFWNGKRAEEVNHFWEKTRYNLTLAKQHINIPFTRILKHIEDGVPLCHNK